MASLNHTRRVCLLYKTILRLHRGLPEEMRSLGDEYVHDEFRRHKKCTPKEATVFMNEWTNYAISLTKQLGLHGPKTGSKLGKPLEVSDLDKFSDDQINQLYELMLTASGKKEDPPKENQ